MQTFKSCLNIMRANIGHISTVLWETSVEVGTEC